MELVYFIYFLWRSFPHFIAFLQKVFYFPIQIFRTLQIFPRTWNTKIATFSYFHFNIDERGDRQTWMSIILSFDCIQIHHNTLFVILCHLMSTSGFPCTSSNISYIIKLHALDITGLSTFLETRGGSCQVDHCYYLRGLRP